MENNNNVSLKNRRIMVVLLIIFLISMFLPFSFIENKGNTLLVFTISGVSTVISFIIAFYLRLRTDAFLIATYGENELDERQIMIRLKAQRSAYDFIINLVMLILPLGYFFRSDFNTFTVFVFAIMIMLKIYLPTMIIAWREKEV